MRKNILKYICYALISATLVLSIITLVNYFSYANVLTNLKNTELDLLTKFELQESKELYLYRILQILPWTCFISAISAVLCFVTLILNLKSKNSFRKIR